MLVNIFVKYQSFFCSSEVRGLADQGLLESFHPFVVIVVLVVLLELEEGLEVFKDFKDASDPNSAEVRGRVVQLVGHIQVAVLECHDAVADRANHVLQEEASLLFRDGVVGRVEEIGVEVFVHMPHLLEPSLSRGSLGFFSLCLQFGNLGCVQCLAETGVGAPHLVEARWAEVVFLLLQVLQEAFHITAVVEFPVVVVSHVIERLHEDNLQGGQGVADSLELGYVHDLGVLDLLEFRHSFSRRL